MNQIINCTLNNKRNISTKGGIIYSILNMIWTAFFFITMVIFIVGAIIIWAIPASILKLVKSKPTPRRKTEVVE